MNEPTLGEVRQQVVNLERGHNELKTEIHSIRSEMSHGFNAIANKLDMKTSPQWQAYGVLVTILIGLGGALFWPIRETAVKHDQMIEMIRQQMVPRIEHQEKWKEQEESQRRSDERLRLLSEEFQRSVRDLAFLQGRLSVTPTK